MQLSEAEVVLSALEEVYALDDVQEITPVPEKYQPRIGDHADHPGEGRGRGRRNAASSDESIMLLADTHEQRSMTD